jgi:hypothetical protein
MANLSGRDLRKGAKPQRRKLCQEAWKRGKTNMM